MSRLFAIAGRPRPTDAVLEGALARLAELGSKTPSWSGAVGLLAEAGAGARLRGLLGGDASPDARVSVTDVLAHYGDRDAQLEKLRALGAALQAGEQVTRPRWQRTSPDSALIAAAAELADAALTAGAEEIASFAFAQLQADPCEEALKALAGVVDAHSASRPWMSAAVEQLARRIATRVVLERLPQELADIATEFNQFAGPPRSA